MKGRHRKDIPTMAQTRAEIIILDEWAEMTWSGVNVPYYKSLGYEYTGRHQKFLCRISDLLPNSRTFVNVQCPVCKETRLVLFAPLSRVKHTLCKGCGRTKDLTGTQFGRLTPVEMDSKRGNSNQIRWICECECGKIISALAANLLTGNYVSCGCYKSDMLSERVGECNSNWNPLLTDEERMDTRKYAEYTDWVKAVMKRDNWTCRCCNQYGGTLEAHHIFSYRHYPHKKTDIDNGATLCRSCHEDFHYNFMGHSSIPCTIDDFQAWLNSK